jgi:hypothetical protein
VESSFWNFEASTRSVEANGLEKMILAQNALLNETGKIVYGSQKVILNGN